MINVRNFYSDLAEHTLSEYPREACGLILRDRYLPCENLATNKEDEFLIDPKIYLEHSHELVAIFHSHPDGLECPSSADMRSQMSSGVPWVILPTKGNLLLEIFSFGEALEGRPLIGRKFRHGVDDCYSLMRDAYKTGLGVELPEFPRDWGWWKKKDCDFYMENVVANGFQVLNADAPKKPWDAMLCSIGSTFQKANHAILYMGEGKGLHHPGSIFRPYDPTRLSLIEGIGNYADSTLVSWVRPRV